MHPGERRLAIVVGVLGAAIGEALHGAGAAAERVEGEAALAANDRADQQLGRGGGGVGDDGRAGSVGWLTWLKLQVAVCYGRSPRADPMAPECDLALVAEIRLCPKDHPVLALVSPYRDLAESLRKPDPRVAFVHRTARRWERL